MAANHAKQPRFRSGNLSICALLVCAAPLGALPLGAAPKAQNATKPSATTPSKAVAPHSSRESIPKALAWLPPAATAQAKLLKELESKAGAEVRIPAYPNDGLIAWVSARYEKAKEAPAFARTTGEHLQVARALLANDKVQERRRGLWVAGYAAFQASSSKDVALCARIHEAFLLPNLDAAYAESWQGLSRESLLQNAAGAYAQAGETENQVRVLRALLPIASNENTRDQTRAVLAQALAQQEKYGEASAHLGAIRQPGLQGMKELVPQYQRRAQEKQLAENAVGKAAEKTAPKQ